MYPDIFNILHRGILSFKRFRSVFLIITGIAMALFCVCTAQANPFTQKNTTPAPRHQDQAVQPAPDAPALPDPGGPKAKTTDSRATGLHLPSLHIMERIIFFQKKIKEKMTALIRQAKETGKTGPLLWVLAAAFVYGVLHSAGPGHGKALALTYIVSLNPTRFNALAFGNILAVSHGMSGAALVFCVKFILETSISGSLASVTRTTQMASYSLIIVLGLFLFVRKLPVWEKLRWKKTKPKKNQPVGDKPRDEIRESLDAKSILPAVLMGMIPCPGVVLAVLFCISLGLSGFGMLLACAITLGMAATLSMVVLAAIAGKSALLAALPRHSGAAHKAGDILEALAGLILCTISLMLLLTLF